VRKVLVLCIVLAVFLFHAGSASANADPSLDALKEDVRASLQKLLGENGTSVSYAVMMDGEIVLADAVGHLDGTKRVPVTVDTLYNIGSVSKVYCAAAIMVLVDQGKIELDAPVVSYLPGFRMQDERYKDITVRMLLEHSSGIPGTPYAFGTSYNRYDTDIYAKVSASFEKSSLKADPGKFSVYCNDGFALAEILIVEVTGQVYSEFLRDSVFTPIGAASSGFSDREYAEGSYAVKGTLPHEFVNFMGAGGVSTSLSDVCRFGQAFLAEGESFLSPASQAEMRAPQGKTFIAEDTLSPEYGLGWDSVNSRFEKYDFGAGVLGKSGGTNQFTSQLYVIPSYNMVCAISATSDFGGSVPDALADIAAGVLKARGVDVTRPAHAENAVSRQALPENFKPDYEGIYGAYGNVIRVVVADDDTISTESLSASGYTVQDEVLYYDGSDFVDEDGNKKYSFVQADGRKYIMGIRSALDYESAMAQKLEAENVEAGGWKDRTEKLYLPAFVDINADEVMAGYILHEEPSLPGILIVENGPRFSPTAIAGDDATRMILQIPGSMGRDLFTLRTKMVDGEEWLYTEYYDFRPADSLKALESGEISIDGEGNNALYKLSGALSLDIPEGGRVIAYDPSGSTVLDSVKDGASAFDKLPSEGYICFIGNPGASFQVTA